MVMTTRVVGETLVAFKFLELWVRRRK